MENIHENQAGEALAYGYELQVGWREEQYNYKRRKLGSIECVFGVVKWEYSSVWRWLN